MSLNLKVFIKTCLPIVLCLSAFSLFGQDETVLSDEQKRPAIDWRKMSGNKNVTFYEVQDAFNEYWKDKTPSKGQGYSVFKRWEANMSPRVYPTGDMSLTSTNYQNYMDWLRENEDNANERSATSNWTTLGPVNVPSGYDAGAGRIDFLHFDPLNSNTMYIGAPDGGLWKSTNGGTSWTTNTDFLAVIGCADLAIHPTVTDTMYLATGNWETDRSTIGVLKSTNGGTSWAATSLVFQPSQSFRMRRLIMDPSNPSIMLAATDGGVYRTTDGWLTHVLTDLDINYNIFDLKFKPGDSDIVYASGKTPLNTDIFWKSEDNGATWYSVFDNLPLSNKVSRSLIGVTAHDPEYVYLLAGDSLSAYNGLFRSTDSGSNFSTQSTSPNILSSSVDATGTDGQAFHDLAIAVSPTDKNKVTIGGICQWRSTNGGVDWNILSYWLGVDPNHPGEEQSGVTVPYTHADIQSINYLPGSSTTFFTTADGGIYKTTNDGTTFTDLSNTLGISQQNVIAQSATTEGLIVTGLQDIGTIMKTGGSWKVIGGGDGEAALIDRTNDLHILTSCPNGAHSISTDGGVTHSLMTDIPSGNLFYCPLVQDPVDATTLYAGGRSKLFQNIDFVNSPSDWDSLGSPPAATGLKNSIIRFAVAPSNHDIIYVIKGNGSNSPTFSKSTNGGDTFTNITGTLPVSTQMTNVAVSNTDADKVWVTYSGYISGTKVFRSTDGGASWENMSTGLPNVPMNTIVYVNNSPTDEVYLGADIGVYYYNNTFDSGGFAPGSWTAFKTGLPNTKVTDLNIFYPTNKLRASTYGRGSWESPITTAVLPVDLVSFTGESRDGQNILSWSTAIEANLESYELQRSKDGLNFESITTIRPDAPNTIIPQDYQYTDKNPLAGKNYYRLQISDLDASKEFSHIVVLVQEDKVNPITLFPNPTSDIIQIRGLSTDNVTLRIINAAGEILRVQQLADSGQVDVQNMPNGTYFLEIKIGSKTVIKQFVKD